MYFGLIGGMLFIIIQEKNMLKLTSKLIRGILNFSAAIQDGRLAIYLVRVGLSVILQMTRVNETTYFHIVFVILFFSSISI